MLIVPFVYMLVNERITLRNAHIIVDVVNITEVVVC